MSEKLTDIKLTLKHEVTEFLSSPANVKVEDTPEQKVRITVPGSGQKHRIILKAGRALKAAGPWTTVQQPCQLRVTIGSQIRHFVAVYDPLASTTTEVMELKPVVDLLVL